MPDFSYELKIPKLRLAVLIGEKGKIKRMLEKKTSSKIIVDSDEGDVFIQGNDSVGLYSCREVINAIGRGFNPEIAVTLLGEDNIFELLDLKEFTKTKKSLVRMKGRIIGQEGKCRRLIEELSETNMCIYGKTVGVIGSPENVATARKAIEMLLRGSPHSTVYKWLEKKRREQKRREMMQVV